MGRIEQLEEFVRTRPEDPFPRYGLALELGSLGRLQEAARVFAELMARFPDYTPGYLHAGKVLAELGQAEEARDVMTAGIDACRRKGDSHALGELEAALAVLAPP